MWFHWTGFSRFLKLSLVLRKTFYSRLLFLFLIVPIVSPICVAKVQTQVPNNSSEVRYDVVVVGGSPSGVSAALAAARRGSRVLLIEERAHLGGEIVYSMLNMFDVPSRPGETAKVHGIFAEFFDQLGMAFDCDRVRTLFENAVAVEPNLQCLVRTEIARLTRRENRDWEMILRRTNQRQSPINRVLIAPLLIDATPDAQIAARCGVKYLIGREGSVRDKRMQAAGLLFSVIGVDWSRLRKYVRGRRSVVGRSAVRRKSDAWAGGTRGNYAYERGDIVRDYHPTGKNLMFLSINFGRQSDGSVILNTLNIVGVDGLSIYSKEKACSEAIAEIPRFLTHLRKKLPGFEHVKLGRVAPELYIRETRHTFGMRTLQVADIRSGRAFSDRIAGVSYPIDLHPYQRGDMNPFGAQRYRYSLPLGALVPRETDGLFVASRSLSASYQAAGSARVIPVTMAAGEAAGAAAWFCNVNALTPHQLLADIKKVDALQQNLRQWGVDVGDKPKPAAGRNRLPRAR